MRTVDDRLDFVINPSHFAVHARYFVVDNMCKFQDLCTSHQGLLMRQLVQSLQRVFHISPSQQLLQVLFFIQPGQLRSYRYIYQGINSLAGRCLISSVAMARIPRTSTIIFIIKSIIACVAGTSV